MLSSKRRIQELAARETLRAEIKEEILEEVRALLSLGKVSGNGVPNLSALNMAVRNIDAASLNLKFFG